MTLRRIIRWFTRKWVADGATRSTSVDALWVGGRRRVEGARSRLFQLRVRLNVFEVLHHPVPSRLKPFRLEEVECNPFDLHSTLSIERRDVPEIVQLRDTVAHLG